jgi:hypothetical protein
MLMSGVIVDYEMEIEPQRDLTVYLAQEFEGLLVAMATETFANDSSPQATVRTAKSVLVPWRT